MECYNNLNGIINKIEDNLTNEINYKELAKIIGTSEYTLQRIFCFLTGITLTEYIRKRRLSKAGEDIQMTESNIIDIAIKYGYDSPAAFSRAFYKMHGILPKEVRKKQCSLKMFSKIQFEPINDNMDELDYRVVKLPEQTFYGKSTNQISVKDKGSIKKLWEKLEQDKILDYIIDNCNENKELYYGATEYIDLDNSDKSMKYYILGRKYKQGFKKLEIPKATWVAFKINSKEQKDILEVIDIIYSKWISTSRYKAILPYPSLEIYYEDYCEYCIAVEE